MNTTKPVSSVSAPSRLVSFALEALCSLLLLLCPNDACIAQESAQPTITVRSTLVMVPVSVNTKKGQPVFDLAVHDFRLTDNGVAQLLTLE